MARTKEQNQAIYQRRKARAQKLGYSGYGERRRANETGVGRLGIDRTEADLRKRVRKFGTKGGEIVQLTKNNKGQRSVKARVAERIEQGKGGDPVTVSYVLAGRSGPIRHSVTMTLDEFDDSYGADAADAAEADADGKYSAGAGWSGAVTNVQVVFR